MKSIEEEKQNVVDWLMHPSELGCKPKKIEFTKEFTDDDGIHCMIFKYKKSLFSPWLLAISSESGVFSEMQEYDPKTEVEDAKKIIDFLKEHWKRVAAEEDERRERNEKAHAFTAFVLLKEPVWEPEVFESSFSNDWGIELSQEAENEAGENASKDGEKSGSDARIYDVGTMRLVLGYMDFKVPNEEAEYWAQFNYMWKEAVEITKTHKAQILVTVMGEGTLKEKGVLYAKAVAALCRQENVIGVYANNIVYEPKFLTAMSEMMADGGFPLFNLVWIGLGRTENGTSAYTCGMNTLGKDEIEIVDSKQKPSELREFLMNIVDYVISDDVILCDGETIGMTNEQRLKIVKSEGVNVDGESLKILY